MLTSDGVPVALIPKYFDLLYLLVERRREAVSKQAIFDCVWSDVIVSDGALAQAVRTIRRALEDDSRNPRFIRTVSRHGYQFVWPDVTEEIDEGGVVVGPGMRPSTVVAGEAVGPLVDRLLALTRNHTEDIGEARELAERLHALGTATAVAALRSRSPHALAIAVMRDARWSVPGAGDVPITGDSESVATIVALIRLRVSEVKRAVAQRWAGAAGVGALGGALAGVIGGIVLYVSPGSKALPESAVALSAIGALAGSVGAAGIGAGLETAEVVARSRRGLALGVCGALGGFFVGAVAQLVVRAILEGLFGLQLAYTHIQMGGAVDGFAIGIASGCGYALATRQPPGGGLAAPVGRQRLAVAVLVGAWCACAAIALSLSGRLLVGGLVHEIARSSQDAQLGLAPLGRLIGEPEFGAASRMLVSAFEGGCFGISLAWGLTRRPRPSSIENP